MDAAAPVGFFRSTLGETTLQLSGASRTAEARGVAAGNGKWMRLRRLGFRATLGATTQQKSAGFPRRFSNTTS